MVVGLFSGWLGGWVGGSFRACMSAFVPVRGDLLLVFGTAAVFVFAPRYRPAYMYRPALALPRE